MNLVGERLTILESADKTKKDKSGTVVLETARTLLIESGNRRIRVEKEGTVFLLAGSGETVAGSKIKGRLEDRLGRRTS